MQLHPESHLDHGLSQVMVDFLLDRFAGRAEFFIETVELPVELGTVPCNLHGPATGSAPVPEAEVRYAPRGTRAYSSRLCDRPAVQTRLVTVIAGPHDGQACILYTAFGGPLSPKEPGDPELKDSERAESERFWAEHALGG